MALQLCHSCQKACDARKCIWVRTLEQYPEGVVRDSKNNIIKCPEYLQDTPETMFRAMSTRQRAQYLGIVEQTYVNYREELSAICRELYVAGHPPLEKGELRWNCKDQQFELHLKGDLKCEKRS